MNTLINKEIVATEKQPYVKSTIEKVDRFIEKLSPVYQDYRIRCSRWFRFEEKQSITKIVNFLQKNGFEVVSFDSVKGSRTTATLSARRISQSPSKKARYLLSVDMLVHPDHPKLYSVCFTKRLYVKKGNKYGTHKHKDGWWIE